MPRRRFRSVHDAFKYLDKEIILNANGRFYVPEYGTEHGSIDDAKAEIKSRQEKRDKAPRTLVWFKAGRMFGRSGEWEKGYTTGHGTGFRGSSVIVTHTDEHGRSRREQESYSNVYPVNEKNDAIISQLVALQQQIDKLEQEKDTLEEQLEHIQLVEE